MTTVRRKLLATVLALALLMIFAKVGFGNADSTLDQQQTSFDSSIVTAIGGGSEQIIAQVVTAGMNGLLTEVWLDLASLDALTVEIQGVSLDGSPNDVVATSETLPQGSLPTSCPNSPSLSVQIVFSSPVYFMAGEQFAIVLRSAGEGGASISLADNPYAEGAYFFDSRPNEPGVWVIDETRDLVFQTYMDNTLKPQLTYKFRAIGEGDTTTGTTLIKGDKLQVTRDRLGVNYDFGKPWGNGASVTDEDNVISIDPTSKTFLTGQGTEQMITTYTTGTINTFVRFTMKGFGTYTYQGPRLEVTLPIYGSVTIDPGDSLVGILLEGTSMGRGTIDDQKLMFTEIFSGVVVRDLANEANPYPYSVISASGTITVAGKP